MGSGSSMPALASSAACTKRRIHAVESFSVAGWTGTTSPFGAGRALVEHLKERVRHALEAVGELDLARHGNAVAGVQPLGKPWLAKAGHDERARAVDDRDLGQRKARARLFELRLVNGSRDGDHGADGRAGDGRHLRHVDIATREVREQVAHGDHAELAQSRRARRADARHARHRLVHTQRGGKPVKGLFARCAHARYSTDRITG